MNHTQTIQAVSAVRSANVAAIARFQIYQQTREGIYATAFKTDSAVEAAGAFVRQSPAFEGGEVRLWDYREQHLSAWVRWSSESTGNAVSVLKRENVFQDRMLAILARQVEAREAVLENLAPGIRVSV